MEAGESGTKGEFVTLATLSDRLRRDWTTEETKALDEALLATINIAHVGMVIPYRRGWIFLAEDST